MPTLTSFFVEQSNTPISIFLSPFLFLSCGLILFFGAPKLSNFIISFSEAEEDNIRLSDSEKITRIALLILGIYIFSNALPQFIQISIDVGLYYKDIEKIPQDVREVQRRWTYVIGPIIKLLIAAILIIGPDKVIGVLSKYDTAFKRLQSSNKSLEDDVNR